MKAFLAVIALTLMGCATAHKMNALSVGMTKAEVVNILGHPKDSSAMSGVEYLRYELHPDSLGRCFAGPREGIADYFVRLVGGRVDSYGRIGDFDSTKDPTLVIRKDVTIREQ